MFFLPRLWKQIFDLYIKYVIFFIFIFFIEAMLIWEHKIIEKTRLFLIFFIFFNFVIHFTFCNKNRITFLMQTTEK